MQFSQAQIVNAIKSFSKGSAPGPSRLQGEHLKTNLKCHTPNSMERAVNALTKLVNVMEGALVPDEFVPFLCEAGHFGALKNDYTLRPTAD